LRAVRGEMRGLTNSRRSRLELRNSQTIDRMADHKITPIETPREGARERGRERARDREREEERARERERERERD
jgi:hypothetical protein